MAVATGAAVGRKKRDPNLESMECPRSSVDRAPASGAGGAGSSPAEGYHRSHAASGIRMAFEESVESRRWFLALAAAGALAAFVAGSVLLRTRSRARAEG